MQKIGRERTLDVQKPSLSHRTITDFSRSDAYRRDVHDVIVGGAHTYSKGDDQFPRLAPAAILRGKNGHVWDVDGNEYVDCSLGLGSVSLGHAYEPVLRPVREALEQGSNFQRPSPLEFEVGRAFLALCPGMDRIKFAKNGSNVTTAAVKLARAFTRRPRVAIAASHPFFSFDDWFIGTTQIHAGVPDPIRGLSLRYDTRNPETLDQLFRRYPGEIACVITEPEELTPIDRELIREANRIARRHGAVFILDEMLSGFRAGLPGSYTEYGFEPDLTTWGKAIGNGFSFCALAGRADIMELGGIRQEVDPRVFLLSSTHGGEHHVLAAALAVIREYREQDVVGTLRRLTSNVAAGVRQTIRDAGLADYIEAHVSSWRIVFVFRDRAGEVSAPHRTLMLQEMIGRGVLYQGVFLPCFTHSADDIAHVLDAFRSSCDVYRQALDGGLEKLLVGEPTRPVFRKYVGCRMSCPAEPCPHESVCVGHHAAS
jgi:glutamate-1-semialdehyde 2,1-aminomutase